MFKLALKFAIYKNSLLSAYEINDSLKLQNVIQQSCRKEEASTGGKTRDINGKKLTFYPFLNCIYYPIASYSGPKSVCFHLAINHLSHQHHFILSHCPASPHTLELQTSRRSHSTQQQIHTDTEQRYVNIL
jgi:hypothetical protein